jgi:predicted metal-dependent hydrolase
MGNGKYPEAYIDYLVQFHATRDYFECHELLEEYWKEHPGDPFADTWVGLIQAAVGSYHYRRGNLQGAVKMFRQSLNRMTARQLEQLGLQGERVLSIIAEQLEAARRNEPFTDMEFPSADQELIRLCEEKCKANGLVWGAASGTEEALVHRHTLRDRSEVIAARAAAAEAKKSKNNG